VQVLLQRPAYLPLIALVVAIWPVWQWLAMRAVQDASDAWALSSLATVAVVLWRDRANDTTLDGDADVLLAYSASYPFVPPLVRAVISMSAMASVAALCGLADAWICGSGACSAVATAGPVAEFLLGYPRA
jgi:hypothetical protein